MILTIFHCYNKQFIMYKYKVTLYLTLIMYIITLPSKTQNGHK